VPTSAAANGKVALVVECVELKARLRKPPGGNASSTRCGKSRSFIRLVISDLRHVIERRGRMTTGRARTLMQLRGGSWEAVEGDAETLRAPCAGLAYAQFNERTVRIKDSARERHGLFRCGVFGAACVAVHRSNIREWYPPGPNSHPTFRSLIRFHFLWAWSALPNTV